jgi:hypothetical protein
MRGSFMVFASKIMLFQSRAGSEAKASLGLKPTLALKPPDRT